MIGSSTAIRWLGPSLAATLLAGCLAAPAASPTPATSPTPSPPATQIAFPTLIPTRTWTPLASGTPTRDPLVGLGRLLFSDTFESPGPWLFTASPTSGAAIDRGRLALAISQAREYHWSVRPEPSAADFYATVDIHAEVCSPGDEFGLIARANTLGEQYRFLIGCDGSARITRFLETGSRALTLRVESPAILPGAPSLNRLAVRVRGLDLVLLVNGQEIVSARDAALARGFFGLIARAGSAGQVSVGFDNLTVYELTDPTATPSPTPPP